MYPYMFFHSQVDLKLQLNRNNNSIATFCLTQANASYCSTDQISHSYLCTFGALIVIPINAAIDRSHSESVAAGPVTLLIYLPAVILCSNSWHMFLHNPLSSGT